MYVVDITEDGTEIFFQHGVGNSHYEVIGDNEIVPFLESQGHSRENSIAAVNEAYENTDWVRVT